jgi:hypothetical protein
MKNKIAILILSITVIFFASCDSSSLFQFSSDVLKMESHINEADAQLMQGVYTDNFECVGV